jgi:hypothetical protein
LEIIGAAVHVAVIVRHGGVNSTALEGDAEPAVIMNGVTENGPGGVIASEAGDADAVKTVKRNDVTLPGTRAADHPVRRIVGGDTTISVAQRHRAGDIGADFVALDNYSCGAASDKDTVGPRIHDIGCARCAAADGGID